MSFCTIIIKTLTVCTVFPGAFLLIFTPTSQGPYIFLKAPQKVVRVSKCRKYSQFLISGWGFWKTRLSDTKKFENVFFPTFFFMKFRFFDNNFPKTKCVTKDPKEIKNGLNFRHFDTLTTFWGAFKKMFDDDWVSYYWKSKLAAKNWIRTGNHLSAASRKF